MEKEVNFHALLFDDAEWAVLTDSYSTDEDIAALVRKAVASAHAHTPTREVENTNTSSLLDTGIERNAKESRGRAEGTEIPPSLDAVKAYFAEKGQSAEEAESFFEYWSSLDWWFVTGKRKMKNWHSAAATWMKNSVKYAADRKAREERIVAARSKVRENVRNRPDNYLAPTEEERKRYAKLF